MRGQFDASGYVSAFIDLLGVSARFLTFDEACRADPGGQNCRVAAQRAFGPIERFREVFRSFYRQFENPSPPGFQDAPPEAQKLFMESCLPNTVIQAVSDSVVVSIPFDLRNELALWRGLLGLVSALGGAQMFVLGLGVLCSGGIALGMACEPYEGEVLGASVTRAVALEKVASLPLVAIDPRLVNTLEQASARQGDDRRLLLGNKLVDRILERFSKENGVAFLDYAGPQVTQVLRKTFAADWEGFLTLAKKNILVESDAADGKAKEKYRWTIDYLASRLSE